MADKKEVTLGKLGPAFVTKAEAKEIEENIAYQCAIEKMGLPISTIEVVESSQGPHGKKKATKKKASR